MANRLGALITVFAVAVLLTPQQAAAQQDVPTTVTVGNGRSVVVGNQTHRAGKKGQIPPGWSVREGAPNAQFLQVDEQRVGMALSAGPEGKLTRVHVDAAEGSDITVVIGFYDQIASADAIATQETYECKKCQRVLVCSVRPQCAE
jgi:hypothetical protein